MIYFDNAATTLHKPDCVIQSVVRAMTELGNSGRGANRASLSASRLIYHTREQLNRLFHGEGPECFAFTQNATQALNTAIKGILQPGDHVITTVCEHNSVLRPLYELEARGTELSFLECDAAGRIDPVNAAKLFRHNTKAIVMHHGSNVTGNVCDIQAISQLAHANGCLLLVDASQTAGIIPIDVQTMGIDLLAFTGHKGLLGPQGTGGLYVRPGITVAPLLTGGSGIHSYSKTHPSEMPTALEAGTLNGHGIAGLSAALKYLEEQGIDTLLERELGFARQFYRGICSLPGITCYGDYSAELRCPIVSFNIFGYSSAEVSDILSAEYGIATRPGAHCAPLLHRAFGTEQQGMVRFSFSHFNTKEEIQAGIQAVRELACQEENA